MERINTNVRNLELLAIRGIDVNGILAKCEIFWRDHQNWLEEMGYILWSRYNENWLPSWLMDSSRSKFLSEDAVSQGVRSLLDVLRVSDGKLVALKKVDVSENPDEVGIGCFFSSDLLAAQSKNQCIPLYDVIRIPDSPGHVLLVMPMMVRFYEPRFANIGEIVEFIRQLFEHKFMHQQNITHCDIKSNNVMSDTLCLYQTLLHPVAQTRDHTGFRGPKLAWDRSKGPVRHYLINFGISGHYPEGSLHLHPPRFSGVVDYVPKFRDNSDQLCDPFAVDVFYTGYLIRKILQVVTYQGLEFLDDLIIGMVQDNPGQSPTMDEVV
ncbi:hypothetical protein BDQ17DRAFT_1514116 [Cyathus striatus]|nr:hypothetical protein BDQ17DRAFT_1514116 [Cyathus striatus]